MAKKRINNLSSIDFHSYKIDWNDVAVDSRNELENMIIEIIKHKELNKIDNPIRYKKIFNSVENRFLNKNLNELVRIGVENDFIDDDFIFQHSSLKIMALNSKNRLNENLIYMMSSENKNYSNNQKFYEDFQDAYALIMNLSKDEYLDYLLKNDKFKENSINLFLENVEKIDDVQEIFEKFNIFEFVTTINEMIDILESIKNKKSFHENLNLILENKHIDLSNILELVSLYNKNDLKNENNFFKLNTIWKLIDDKNFNESCIDYIPQSLKETDLKLLAEDKLDINNSIVKIFSIEDLTLERYKFLEKTLNLDSLNNKLFNNISNNSINEDKAALVSFFDLTQFFSIDELDLSDDVYDILLDTRNNTVKELRNSFESIIGYEYIEIFNNEELFNYLFNKYEKTLNKEALLIIYGNLYLEKLENPNIVLDKFNYDLSNFNEFINAAYCRSAINQLFHYLYRENENNFDKFNNKLKIDISEKNGLENKIYNYFIGYFKDAKDNNNKYNGYEHILESIIKINHLIDNEFLINKMKSLSSDCITYDVIMDFEKKLIEENNLYTLEMFQNTFKKDTDVVSDIKIKPKIRRF